jgi:ubiquinone/menaquinone biosynthesis C-methylase UbiE
VSVSGAGYWNGREDALDWKRPRRSRDDGQRLARESFWTPETDLAVSALGDLRGKRMLEIACAQGYGSLELAARGALVTGVDLAERRCAAATRAAAGVEPGARPRFLAARAEALPFASGSFDLVFCRDVLMYAEPRSVLSECYRVLAPGGRAAFVESLDGHAGLRWFRRRTSPSEYLAFTHHLSWAEMEQLVWPFTRRELRAHHLLAQASFGFLFVLRSTALHRAALRLFAPIDAWLLGVAPKLARFAWRATLVVERPSR